MAESNDSFQNTGLSRRWPASVDSVCAVAPRQQIFFCLNFCLTSSASARCPASVQAVPRANSSRLECHAASFPDSIARCGHDNLRGATVTSFVSIDAVASRWPPRGVPAQPSRVPSDIIFSSAQPTTRCGAMKHEAEAQDTVCAATRPRRGVAAGPPSDRVRSKHRLWLVKYCLAST